jgi:hypothetical protein
MKQSKEASCNFFKRGGEVVEWGETNGGDVTNEQYQPNQNCHHESPLYNEYTLIKKNLKRK